MGNTIKTGFELNKIAKMSDFVISLDICIDKFNGNMIKEAQLSFSKLQILSVDRSDVDMLF